MRRRSECTERIERDRDRDEKETKISEQKTKFGLTGVGVLQ